MKLSAAPSKLGSLWQAGGRETPPAKPTAQVAAAGVGVSFLSVSFCSQTVRFNMADLPFHLPTFSFNW